MSSFTRAQDTFQQQNALWNKVHKGQAVMNFDQSYKSKLEYLQVV